MILPGQRLTPRPLRSPKRRQGVSLCSDSFVSYAMSLRKISLNNLSTRCQASVAASAL